VNQERQQREKVISAALHLAATRQHLDYEGSEPGPYDDARRELDEDVLGYALDGYLQAHGIWSIQHSDGEEIQVVQRTDDEALKLGNKLHSKGFLLVRIGFDSNLHEWLQRIADAPD
jgi:hypothetical protein